MSIKQQAIAMVREIQTTKVLPIEAYEVTKIILEKLQSLPEDGWISVEDSTPAYDNIIQIRDAKRVWIGFASFNSMRKVDYNDYFTGDYCFPTHYQPLASLPSPPNTKTND